MCLQNTLKLTLRVVLFAILGVLFCSLPILAQKQVLPIKYDANLANKFRIDEAAAYTQTFDRTAGNKLASRTYLKPPYGTTTPDMYSTWQNGNGLAQESTIPGWYLGIDGASVSSFTIYGNGGAITNAGVFSYGAEGDNERSIGGRGGSFNSQAVTLVYAAVRMKNTSSKIVKNFVIDYAIEQWYYDGDQTDIELQYAIGPYVLSADATNVQWYSIEVVKSPISSGTVGVKSGKIVRSGIKVKADPGVNLAPGQEITFRWVVRLGSTILNKFNGLSLDDVTIKATGVGNAEDLDNKDSAAPSQTVYYNRADKKLDEIEAWGTNLDGTGTRPRNFTDPNQTFIIKNFKQEWSLGWWFGQWAADEDDDDDDDDKKKADELRDNSKTLKIRSKNGWVVSGANSRIQIGDGVNPVKVSIEKDKFIVGQLDLASLATLVINMEKDDEDEAKYGRSLVPTFGNLSPSSTVVYADSTDLKINAGVKYGNLIVMGNNYTKTMKRATQTLLESVTVQGNLRLDGKKLKLNDKNLIIEENGGVENVNTNSYIVAGAGGKVRRKLRADATKEYVFPVGTDTDYTPVKIKGSNKAVSVQVGVKDGIQNPDKHNGRDQQAVVGKTWVIGKEVLADGTPTSTVTLQWADPTGALDEAKTTEMYIGRYNATAEQWELKPVNSFIKDPVTGLYEVVFDDNFRAETGTLSASPVSKNLKVNTTSQAMAAAEPTTESNEVTVFRGSGPNPLPVELQKFTAARRGEHVELKWQTASETDNSHFDIEYSTDGLKFAKVGQVAGAGNSTVARSYEFVHAAAAAGVVYYRLAQVDADGTITYSRTVDAAPTRLGNIVKAYPNPTQYEVQLTRQVDMYVLRNLQGQELQRGKDAQRVLLNNRVPGVYLLEVNADGEVQQLKIIKR